jgi:hypothetical protein
MVGPSAIGIGEGHAQFDDVGAARHQRAHQRQRQGGIGIAGGNEGDQRLAPLAGKLLERVLDARHQN